MLFGQVRVAVIAIEIFFRQRWLSPIKWARRSML